MGRMRDFVIQLLKDSLEENAGFIHGKLFVRVRDVKKKEKKRINDKTRGESSKR